MHSTYFGEQDGDVLILFCLSLSYRLFVHAIEKRNSMTALTKLFWLPDFIFYHPYTAMPYSRRNKQKIISEFYKKQLQN